MQPGRCSQLSGRRSWRRLKAYSPVVTRSVMANSGARCGICNGNIFVPPTDEETGMRRRAGINSLHAPESLKTGRRTLTAH